MTVPPRISILLPARDAAATLPACLRSIARQSLTTWECVVVDDGSRDATLACARRAARDDPRFVVVAADRRGIVAALNAGLARCRAGVIARMDADDLMHRDRLAAQLRLLDAEPALDAVGCHVRLFPRAALSDRHRAYERWLNGIDSPRAVRAEAYVECPLAHPTLTIRADVLRAFGYRERGWPEDYDLILRLLAAGREIGVVPRRLLAWRDAATRASRTDPTYALARFVECKAEFLARDVLARHERYVLWGYGHTGRALRRALLARGKRPSHIVELHPGRLGNVIGGAPVVPPDALPRLAPARVIVSVARAGPRAEIRRAMAAMGFREGDDFVCAA